MKLPPREWIQTMRAAFKDPEPIIETYLNTFKPDPAPYRRTHDRAMRYRDAADVNAWGEFIVNNDYRNVKLRDPISHFIHFAAANISGRIGMPQSLRKLTDNLQACGIRKHR